MTRTTRLEGKGWQKPTRWRPTHVSGSRFVTELPGQPVSSAAQFEAYANETAVSISGCSTWNGREWVLDAARSWQAPGFDQTATDPVVCVSWTHANGYVNWLSQKAGQPYRLPSEAEWEYAARAGTTSRRWWGDSAAEACGNANVADAAAKRVNSRLTVHKCGDGFVYTAPVGKFRANGFGLFDVLGNAWEWTEDCYHDSYTGGPGSGEAWTTGPCDRRVLRGGSWLNAPRLVRSAYREGYSPANRPTHGGFRVARTLPTVP
jgi:formylglycine-generating enzyme required for sulfatase activity